MEKLKKLKPAGWLALIVGTLFVIGVVGVLGRAIWMEFQGLGGLTAAPTPAPRTPTSTLPPIRVITPASSGSAASTRVPMPDGWTTEADPVTGKTYWIPSPEVEARLREAFESVLACKVAVVTDAVPDSANQPSNPEQNRAFQKAVLDDLGVTGEDDVERLVAYQHAVQDQAERFLANEWVLGERGCAYGGFQAVIPADHLEPVPVRCESSRACTVGMVKKNYAVGVILYTSPQLCQEIGLNDPCASPLQDASPFLLYLARVERDGEDGPWQVTAFQTEKIQKPAD